MLSEIIQCHYFPNCCDFTRIVELLKNNNTLTICELTDEL